MTLCEENQELTKEVKIENASSAVTGLLPECRASPTTDSPLGLFV
jgi:hypothetical protein